ncbi:hypothetical protein [Glaciihabitans sp. GrIS 2.15]|uniref:hypothetical protein n=1 Tax=Glaciihabitans sp. GrIS 2.15 TaxID=3071710 RepID=UPI002DF98895|nr:hypothetical protein [Glaciihabitans sp. GrIS 2.15]
MVVRAVDLLPWTSCREAPGPSGGRVAVRAAAVVLRGQETGEQGIFAEGASASTELVHSTSARYLRTTVRTAGETATVHNYDAAGRLVQSRTFTGITTVVLQPGEFAVVTR